MQVRDHERLAAGSRRPACSRRSRPATRHAFVATDLLWLDGTPLHDIPLLERKRLLDAVLDESYLVRVAPFVPTPPIQTQVTWASMGFRGAPLPRARTAATSTGEENPDCAVARAAGPAWPSVQGRR